MKKREKLQKALDEHTLISVKRSRFDPWHTVGYVMAVGPKFFLLQLVEGEIHYNGYQAIARNDLSSCKVPHKHAAFVEKALELKGETAPNVPEIDMSSAETILQNAQSLFTLVTIHREKIDPDVCQIGQVESLSDSTLMLKEIDPDAEWDDEPTEYALKDITRIDFGGKYEEALALVAGIR